MKRLLCLGLFSLMALSFAAQILIAQAQVTALIRPDTLQYWIPDDPLTLRTMERRDAVSKAATPKGYERGRYYTKTTPNGFFDPTLAAEFQFVLDSIRQSAGQRAVVAAVNLPGQGTWVGVSGMSSTDPPQPADPSMLFAIASNTKSFVSTLLVLMAEEGLLLLDDSLYKWIPKLPNVDSTITIRQLLSMRTGVFDFFNDWPDNRAGKDCYDHPNVFWSPESTIQTYVAAPHFAAGTTYKYSNTNYLLAGMIARKVLGGSISTALRERILDKLNLDHTFFDQEELLQGLLLHPWQGGTDWYALPRTAYYSMVWSAGAFFSNVEDLCVWIRELNEGSILSENGRAQMREFQPVPGTSTDREYGYGLGIEQTTQEGRLFIGHTGGMPGYQSLMYYMPEHRMSIVVIINQRPISIFFGYLRALARVVLRREHVEPAMDGVIYAASGSSGSGQLFQVDVSNGAAHAVAPYRYPDIVGLEIDSAGKQLIGIAKNYASWDVIRFDGVTGKPYPVTVLPIYANLTIKAVALTPDSILYLSANAGWLYKTKIGSSNLQYLADTHLPINGMAFNTGTGELWAAISSNHPDSVGTVYRISLPTGSVSRVGSTGLGEPVRDLMFDDIGCLWGLSGNVGQPTQLIVLDTLTGMAQVIGSLGVNDVSTFTVRSRPVTSVESKSSQDVPLSLSLLQNYPNPFNPRTTIEFVLPTEGQVRLVIHDMLGREVVVLADRDYPAGSHAINWDATGRSSGVYFVRLTFGTQTYGSKLVLQK